MNAIIKNLLFLNKPWPVRIWIWSAIGCMVVYLVKSAYFSHLFPIDFDMVLVAYGLGSIAIYILIFQFDWS